MHDYPWHYYARTGKEGKGESMKRTIITCNRCRKEMRDSQPYYDIIPINILAFREAIADEQYCPECFKWIRDMASKNDPEYGTANEEEEKAAMRGFIKGIHRFKMESNT